ncbi:MAG: DDE-type integrase/transposase/recombinase, partial [Selenomonadaceae bacterium]|nr:DDE-type integrase/transposase/recombinase [Selenomonadaceae bacterium]
KDLCTKKIVGYSVSNRIDSKLVCEALKMAINRQKPSDNLIFHSDRGSQYSSYAFRKLLAINNIKQSMSRKGNPYDNAVAENFFSCLKCEFTFF